jgi:flagellar biosynthesis protein FlhB
MSGEKTEKPTAQRKKQARKEGTIARTPELGAWAGMLAASVVLPTALRTMMSRAQDLLGKLPSVIAQPDPTVALHMLRDAAMGAAAALAPLCLTIMVVGIASSAAQGGLRPTPKLVMPKFDRHQGAGQDRRARRRTVQRPAQPDRVADHVRRALAGHHGGHGDRRRGHDHAVRGGRRAAHGRGGLRDGAPAGG